MFQPFSERMPYALLKINRLVIASLFLGFLWNELSPAVMLQGQNQGLHQGGLHCLPGTLTFSTLHTSTSD